MCKPWLASEIGWCSAASPSSTRSADSCWNAASPLRCDRSIFANLLAVIEDAEQSLSSRLRWRLERLWQERKRGGEQHPND